MTRLITVLVALLVAPMALADTYALMQAQPTPPQSEVKLSNGETLKGEVTKQDANGIVLKHPVLGDIALRPDQYSEVKAIEPPAPVSPWKSYVNASVSGVQSTNDTIDVRLAGGTVYKEDGWLFQFDAQWYYRSNNG